MGLMQSQVAVFSFDGTELDSGTVVEFMACKFLDIPAVIYRTDFRGGSGEEPLVKESLGPEHCYKWNLMCSFYPRTKVIYLNAMVEYQKVFSANQGKSALEISRLYSEVIASKIIVAMEEVMATPKILSAEKNKTITEDFYRLMNIETESGVELTKSD